MTGYVVVNGWIAEDTGEHTCGAGPAAGGCEAGCGLIPLVEVSEVLDRHHIVVKEGTTFEISGSSLSAQPWLIEVYPCDGSECGVLHTDSTRGIHPLISVAQALGVEEQYPFRFEVVRSKVVPPGVAVIGSPEHGAVLTEIETTPDFPGPTPVAGGRWVKIDEVSVDSGQIQIHDPAMHDSGPTFASGLGDGGYEVWMREVEIEPDDWRYVEVRITLIEPEDAARWISGY